VKSPWPWIALATAGWASGNITAKLALDGGMSPLSLTLVRFGIAAVGMVAILRFLGRLDNDHDWRRGSFIGLLNMAMPPIFFTIALATLHASLAGLLIALIPAATIVAAHFIVPGERFRAWRIPGLVVALAGITILLGGVRSIDPASLRIALIWSALGVVSAGAGGAVTRRFALETPTRRMLVPQFVAAAVVLFVLGVPTGAWGGLAGLPGDVWGWAIATGIFGTIVPFHAFLQVVERTEVARAALIAYLVPVVSAISAVLFLGDPVTASLVIGGAVIMTGVVLADRVGPVIESLRRRPKPTSQPVSPH
jgi:drug/metabolite transporter (DMT)-like permease